MGTQDTPNRAEHDSRNEECGQNSVSSQLGGSVADECTKELTKKYSRLICSNHSTTQVAGTNSVCVTGTSAIPVLV